MKLLIIGFILIALISPGCATKEPIKPQPKSTATLHPGVAIPDRTVSMKLIKIFHYDYFVTEPPGAEVLVIDTRNGKEVQSFGKTPVKILLVTKTAQYDTINKRLLGVTNTVANTVGITYGQERVEGAEFQFKFRLPGYDDEIIIERIPLLSPDTDRIIKVTMKPTVIHGQKKDKPNETSVETRN